MSEYKIHLLFKIDDDTDDDDDDDDDDVLFIKYTEEDHPDYKHLRAAEAIMKEVAVYINEYKRRKDLGESSLLSSSSSLSSIYYLLLYYFTLTNLC